MPCLVPRALPETGTGVILRGQPSEMTDEVRYTVGKEAMGQGGLPHVVVVKLSWGRTG